MSDSDDVGQKSPPASEDIIGSWVPHPYQSLNADGEILSVNDAWLKLLGYEEDKVIGQWFGDFLTEKSKQKFETRFEKFKAGGGVSDVEFGLTCADGENIFVSFDGRIEYDEDGNFVRTHCQFQDITERKKNERELENREAKYRSLFEGARDPIILLNENGFFDCNEMALELFGFDSMEKFNEQTPWDLSPETQPDGTDSEVAAKNRIETAFEDGEAFFEWVHTRSDGTEFPAEVKLSRFELDGDPVLHELVRDITERKEREQEIQQLKDRLELAIDGANLGVWDWDVHTDEVQFNDNWATMLGYEPSEIDSHLEEWEKRVHPDDVETVEKALDAHIAGETEYYDTEHRMQTADGGWKWIRDLGKVFERDEDGEAIRAVGIHIDINERKEYERQLQREKDRAEQFFETAGIIFVLLDLTGNVTRINTRGSRLLGYEKDELLGENWFETVLPEEVEPDVSDVFEQIASGTLDGVEKHTNYIETKDGERRYIQWHNTPFRDPSGEITGVLSSGLDITERREKQRELERHDAYLEHAHDIVTVVDEEGNIKYQSKTTDNFTGYSADELIGAEGFEYVHPDDRERISELFSKILNHPDVALSDEIRAETKDGEWRWIESRGVNKLHDESISGIIVTTRDITDRKEYERRLKEQRDDLTVLNEVLRHDIRNDLQLVTAYADMLKDEVGEDEQEYAKIIQKNARKAVDLTQTARDMAEVMLSENEIDSPVNIRSPLESNIEEFQSTYPNAAITVEGPIPSVSVYGNDMLNSVFHNTLQNAVEHNDKDVPRVRVSAVESSDSVTVEIADNGPGIPDDQKEAIFGKGEKGLESAGTGIGLYLVESIIEKSGGEVWVEDNEPEGSVFAVELPKADSDRE